MKLQFRIGIEHFFSAFCISVYRYGTLLNYISSLNLKVGNLISSFHDKGNAEAGVLEIPCQSDKISRRIDNEEEFRH